MSNILVRKSIKEALSETLAPLAPDRMAIITDTNVYREVYPKVASLFDDDTLVITVPAGEEAKCIGVLNEVWEQLLEGGITRNSLVINLGGGCVTDLGGFAAATYKRGVRFINAPTTLLGAVDAAVGGKTGINVGGAKNMAGVFAPATAVTVGTDAFDTLDETQMISGFGEIVKMSMIGHGPDYKRLLTLEDPFDPPVLQELLSAAMKGKEAVVALDPYEQGLRKILNFGHTAGHAIESRLLALSKPVPHGVAVAYGIMVALILSHILLGFPSDKIEVYRNAILRRYFPAPEITCKDYDALSALLAKDKKNIAGSDPRFVLLRDIADPVIDIEVSDADFRTALDIFLNL